MIARVVYQHWLRWRYRRHVAVGHPDAHDGCRECRAFRDRLDPTVFGVIDPERRSPLPHAIVRGPS